MNDGYIDRTSYDLLNTFFAVPPGECTIHAGTIKYELSHNAVLMGIQGVSYFIEVDYEGCATESYSVRESPQTYTRFLTTLKQPFWFSQYIITDQEISRNPFLVKSDSFPILTSIVSVSKTFAFTYNNERIEVKTCEVLMNPFFNGDDESALHFKHRPVYVVEMYVPESLGNAECHDLLKTLVPSIFFQ